MLDYHSTLALPAPSCPWPHRSPVCHAPAEDAPGDTWSRDSRAPPQLRHAQSAALTPVAPPTREDLTAQHDAVAGLGVAAERISVDHGPTGTNRDRPGLREALAACRAGEERLLVIGPDRHGALLELVAVPAHQPTRIIHADQLQPSRYDYLR